MADFKILKTTPLPDSEVEIEGEISVEKIESFRQGSIKKLNSKIKIDGFREGRVPEKVLIEKIGELAVVEEAGSLALESLFVDIIKDSGINPVGRPEVIINKLAPNNPLAFKIKTAVVPEIKLPDYKKVAKEVGVREEKAEVSDQEFEDMLIKIKKSRIPPRKEADLSTKEAGVEEPLPELTDDLVKSFGDFKSVEDFKNKIRENLILEKELRIREKRRLEIIEKTIADTSIELPKILIESEQEKMLAQFKGNISGMGLQPEDYFKQIGKSEEDIKKEWKDEAVKRAKMELILQKIALEEKIEVPKEELEKEAMHLLSHHKDADPLRARTYIEQILIKEKVWQFLEGQK